MIRFKDPFLPTHCLLPFRLSDWPMRTTEFCVAIVQPPGSSIDQDWDYIYIYTHTYNVPPRQSPYFISAQVRRLALIVEIWTGFTLCFRNGPGDLIQSAWVCLVLQSPPLAQQQTTRWEVRMTSEGSRRVIAPLNHAGKKDTLLGLKINKKSRQRCEWVSQWLRDLATQCLIKIKSFLRH